MILHDLMMILDPKVLTLQHLSEVEGFVNAQGGSNAGQAMLTEVLYGGHDVGSIVHQVQQGALGAADVAGHLAHHELGLAQRSNRQEHQDRMNLIQGGPHPINPYAL